MECEKLLARLVQGKKKTPHKTKQNNNKITSYCQNCQNKRSTDGIQIVLIVTMCLCIDAFRLKKKKIQKKNQQQQNKDGKPIIFCDVGKSRVVNQRVF